MENFCKSEKITGLIDKILMDLMPHRHCFLDEEWSAILYTLSNIAIGLSYMIISGLLVLVVIKRENKMFRLVSGLYGSFIFCCGISHFFMAYNMYYGKYNLEAIWLAITAVVSILSAFVTFALTSPVIIMDDEIFNRIIDKATK